MIDTGKTGEFRYEVPNQPRTQDSVEFGLTPSQTVGPYVHIGLELEGSELLVDANTPSAVKITFTVTDGDGEPVKDAMIEIWQANEAGAFNTTEVERFRGLGRSMADDTGTAEFVTLVPGATEDEAPHLKVGVFARGILERLYTRLYFPENEEQNQADPVFSGLEPARRELMVAKKTTGGYHLDIVLQHEDPAQETPFFRV